MELSGLIERVQSGDRQAFADLTGRYQDLAFGYAFAVLGDFHLAQDAAQEALVVTYFELGKLQDPEAFPGWLRGIVRHQCYRILRKRHFELVSLDQAAEISTSAMSLDEQVELQDEMDRVLAEVAALPQPQREVITLFYIREYSQQEVATFLSLPLSTVNNRLHAARKQLKRRVLPMVKDAFKEHALPEDFATKVGTIVEVRGPVIDARFAPDRLPVLLSALTIDDGRGRALTVQAVQHLGDGLVRCIAVSPADGLIPGMNIVNTGDPIGQPIGVDILGRTFALLGTPSTEADRATPTFLETGIKIVDLLCPFTMGGKVAILGSNGVGKLVFTEEIVHNVASRGDGVALFTFVQPGKEVSIAQSSFDEGYGQGGGTVQTFILATNDPTEPAPDLSSFDATVVMTTELAKRNLWPAIDPLRSHSRLLEPAILGAEHVAVTQQVRDLLRRAGELQASTNPRSDEDERILARALKLEHFFTQPFFFAEPYTKRPGAYVPREVTLRDCAAILAGEYDHLPDTAFLYRGSLDDIDTEPSAR